MNFTFSFRWGFILGLSLLASLGQYFSWFRIVDLALYDSAQRFNGFSAAEDLLIIDIDERSLSELGAWPWSRRLHGDLLDELSRLGIQHVAFDIIFAEASPVDSDGDTRFAEAIARHGGVTLPLFIGQLQRNGFPYELPPAPLFYAAEPAVGHIHIQCDSDGICRSVFLREGVGDAAWPHLALAMLQQQRFVNALPGRRAPSIDQSSPRVIYRDFHNYIRLPSSNHGLKVVSYADIIAGIFDAGAFDGHTAFVGASAAALGDVRSTPRGALPGVLINAVVYQQLRENSLVQSVPNGIAAICVFFFGVFILWACSRLTPLMFLLAVFCGVLVLYAAMTFGLSVFFRWFPVASLMVLLAAYYPLWNWFKLQLAVGFLRQQLNALSAEGPLQRLFAGRVPQTKMPAIGKAQGVEVVSDTVQQIALLDQHVRGQQHMLEVALGRLQEAVILSDEQDRILLANEAARIQFNVNDFHTLADLARQLKLRSSGEFDDWVKYLRAAKTGNPVPGIECERIDTQGVVGEPAVFYCRVARLALDDYLDPSLVTAPAESATLMMLNFTDISPIKAAERAKMDAMHFLSHDLRAPMVSILAMINGMKSGRNARPIEENLTKIEQYAESNLRYSEMVLQLSRAENLQEDAFTLVDLHSILDAALMDNHEIAEAKEVSLAIQRDDADAWIEGHAESLERTVVNLINNAVKYSDPKSEVRVQLGVEPLYACVSVCDDGPGIDPEDQPVIFDRYKRGRARSGQLGAGLGLFFVSTVVKKHGGIVRLESEMGRGACFHVRLPLASNAPTE